MNISAVYIHIPFCKRRCFYCDFPITVLGDSAGNKYSAWQEEYVDWLCREIIITSQENQEKLTTIFFGGGTPSLLAIEGLEKIFQTLNRCFTISKNAEISLEIDPATFDLTKLKQYQSLGINRVSLGVQAFQTDLLATCGRSHSINDIYQGIEWINTAGLENWSLDLISGLPNQTIIQWQKSLEKAILCQPKHISCYDLVLEDSTVFGKKYQAGNYPLPPDDIAAKMYCLASEILQKAKYIHYEISNYALENYQCKHNQVYWHNQSYYGFGMGAASYTNNKRFTRPRTRKEYFKWVNQLEKNQGKINISDLSKTDELLETLMLNLRLKEGIKLKEISDKFGEKIAIKIKEILKPYEQQKLIEFQFNNQQINLTDPQGFLYSNSVLAELFKSFSE
jgi:oxygen-independent coproporphyrinogen-3 oxidase